MLFPSLHDQAGWVVAEASSAGCPVVCLPLGGPPILAGPNAYVAPLEGDVVANLAEQLVAAGESRGEPHARWSRDRLVQLVDDWYADAIGSQTSPPVS
jgi:glycosyltransferase involved in cell wall biosynthesis